MDNERNTQPQQFGNYYDDDKLTLPVHFSQEDKAGLMIVAVVLVIGFIALSLLVGAAIKAIVGIG